MRKSLVDLADYLKSIIPPEIDESYRIKECFKKNFNEKDIILGIIAYREFLLNLFNLVHIKGNNFDSYTKVAHEYENRTTLSVYYPFMNNIKTFLLSISIHGVLSNNNKQIVCSNHILDKKLSISKTLEMLHFFSECGLLIEGINLNDTKLNIESIKSISISYPINPNMLLGMKVLANAESELGTLSNQDIFFRCDYRVIKENDFDAIEILKDTITPLSSDIQEFVLQIHKQYLNKKMKCVLEIKGYYIYLKYSYKGKDLWGVNASLNNGLHINIKAKNMTKYPKLIQTFKANLQGIINNGYGCGRKREGGKCDGGCRGMIVPLDGSILDIKDNIVAWLDEELSYL